MHKILKVIIWLVSISVTWGKNFFPHPLTHRLQYAVKEVWGIVSSLSLNNLHKQSCFLTGLYFFARICVFPKRKPAKSSFNSKTALVYFHCNRQWSLRRGCMDGRIPMRGILWPDRQQYLQAAPGKAYDAGKACGSGGPALPYNDDGWVMCAPTSIITLATCDRRVFGKNGRFLVIAGKVTG